MIVPASNGERELPRLSEHNPYHDPENGRFTSAARAGESREEIGVLKILRSHFQQWKKKTGNRSWGDFLVSRKRDWQRMQERNPCHEPAGTPKGGQFAPKGTGNCEEIFGPPTLSRDSRDLYKTGGQWTTDRKALHDDIVTRATVGVPPSTDPTVYMTGGGPASGKSMMIRLGLIEVPPEGQAVKADPDWTRMQFPDYQQKVLAGDRLAAPFVQEEASEVTKRIIDRGMTQKSDIILDGVGNNGIDNLSQKLQSYRARGYKIYADYATIPTDMAVREADLRALRPGPDQNRWLQHSYIRAAHAGVSTVVPQAIKRGLYDRFRLWDTRIRGNPRLVATAVGKKLTVHNRRLWRAFLSKAKG